MRKTILTLILLCVVCGAALCQVNKQYFVSLGRDMVMDNRYKEAIETLNILLNADPEAYEGYFWRGIAKYSLNDLLGAEQDFSTTLTKNPVYTTAYQFRAMTQARLGNYDKAFKDFEEAIELRPDYQAPYYSRGVAHIITKQYDKALIDFNSYLRINSKDIEAYANRGVAHLNLRDTLAAMDDFNRAIRINRDSPRGYAERGWVYLSQKSYNLAIDDFDSAIKCDSTNLASYFNRSIAHYGKKNLIAALADLSKVIEIDPTSSVAYFNRALLRTEIGDYNKALEDYNKAALYSPDNVLVYFNRATLYRKLGELRSALKDYNHAIELLPNFSTAYMARAEVKYLLQDSRGAARDHNTAQRKIAEYKASTNKTGDASSYADTTTNFSRLLSFDTHMGSNTIQNISTSEKEKITLRPLYKFTLRNQKTLDKKKTIDLADKNLLAFTSAIGDSRISFSSELSNLSADELVTEDNKISAAIMRTPDRWKLFFRRSITQSLLRQYTNAINSLSTAIELEPTNPFLYISRSSLRAEMTDFISSMDGEYVRIPFERNNKKRHKDNTERTYNYEEAISDLNKAAKLLPNFAHIYYNRGNLLTISGDFAAAEVDYTLAININPSFADAYFNRGLIKIYTNNIREGLLDMSKAGELGIDNAYAILKIYSLETDNTNNK